MKMFLFVVAGCFVVSSPLVSLDISAVIRWDHMSVNISGVWIIHFSKSWRLLIWFHLMFGITDDYQGKIFSPFRQEITVCNLVSPIFSFRYKFSLVNFRSNVGETKLKKVTVSKHFPLQKLFSREQTYFCSVFVVFQSLGFAVTFSYFRKMFLWMYRNVYLTSGVWNDRFRFQNAKTLIFFRWEGSFQCQVNDT